MKSRSICWAHVFPWKECIWKKCYMQCGVWNQMKIWSSHLLFIWTAFFTLCDGWRSNSQQILFDVAHVDDTRSKKNPSQHIGAVLFPDASTTCVLGHRTQCKENNYYRNISEGIRLITYRIRIRRAKRNKYEKDRFGWNCFIPCGCWNDRKFKCWTKTKPKRAGIP